MDKGQIWHRDDEFTQTILQDGPTCGLTRFCMEGSRITLTVAPWPDPAATRVYRFEEARLLALSSDEDDPDGDLPWDIIGLHCRDRAEGLQEFYLFCGGGELRFLAHWPERDESLPQQSE